MYNHDSKDKNRVFLYIVFLGLLMFGVISYISYLKYNNKMDMKFEKLTNSLQSIINTEEERIVKLYQSRLTKNLKSYGVIDSIKNKDRKELYSLIKPRYEELIKENKYFKVMHFHNKDSSSFLRMHKPNKYGDDLSSIRQVVVDTNKLVKPFWGFEKGVYGYYYRVITPVIYQKEHLGTVEFGLTLEYFINNLKRLVPETNFGLMIKKDEINSKDVETIKDHALIIDYNTFFKPISKQIDLSKKYQTIKKGDKTYLVSSNIYIKDYKGKDAIRVLFAIDITDYKKEIINEFLFLLIIGGLTYFISLLIINTAFKRYISSIESQAKTLREYTDIIDEFVIVSSTDTKGNITYASEAFCKICGYSKEELLGRSHNIVKHPDMEKAFFKKMWTALSKKEIWRGEFKNKKKNGDFYWVDAVISPHYDDNNKIDGYTAIRIDITDKKIIEKISQTDKLTQIYNRQKLDTVLELEQERTNRYKTPFSVILLDIDKFKSVNDIYGHQVGDSVLIQTAQILSKHIRKTDTLGRWGGEEFMIICSETDLPGAESLAETLRREMETFSFDTVGEKTASFGVSQFMIGEDTKELLKRCDDALYESKNEGRNRVSSK